MQGKLFQLGLTATFLLTLIAPVHANDIPIPAPIISLVDNPVLDSPILSRSYVDHSNERVVIYVRGLPLLYLKANEAHLDAALLQAKATVLALNAVPQNQQPLQITQDLDTIVIQSADQTLIRLTPLVQAPLAPDLQGVNLALGLAQQISKALDLPKPLINERLQPKPASALAALNSVVERVIQKFSGRASWYGNEFHGRPTASGARFDAQALTAAHRTLPFGTKIRVTNLSNGQNVVVKVNDRGPFSPGRILDVSRAAAQVLGMIRSGTANVKIEVLKKK